MTTKLLLRDGAKSAASHHFVVVAIGTFGIHHFGLVGIIHFDASRIQSNAGATALAFFGVDYYHVLFVSS
jgi:hypothetical protein